MIGYLVELSAVGRSLHCRQHLKGYVGLIVDVHKEYNHGRGYTQKYWIEWVGIGSEEAYPFSSSGRQSLTNGTWNRRDFKIVKKNK